MNSKKIGDITTATILSHLLQKGYFVLLPFGDSLRYDLVVEKDNKFERIQCKTGRLKDGFIVFSTASLTWYPTYNRKNYVGQIDYFGVYCPQNGKCYLIPVDQVGQTRANLRVEPTKNSQNKNIRWATEFEI